MSLFKDAWEGVRNICYRTKCNDMQMKGSNYELSARNYDNGKKSVTIYGSQVFVDGVLTDVLPVVMRHAVNGKK